MIYSGFSVKKFMKISIIAFLPVVAGLVAAYFGGRVYKKNERRKKEKSEAPGNE